MVFKETASVAGPRFEEVTMFTTAQDRINTTAGTVAPTNPIRRRKLVVGIVAGLALVIAVIAGALILGHGGSTHAATAPYSASSSTGGGSSQPSNGTGTVSPAVPSTPTNNVSPAQPSTPSNNVSPAQPSSPTTASGSSATITSAA